MALKAAPSAACYRVDIRTHHEPALLEVVKSFGSLKENHFVEGARAVRLPHLCLGQCGFPNRFAFLINNTFHRFCGEIGPASPDAGENRVASRVLEKVGQS